jgi:hypothetical protein
VEGEATRLRRTVQRLCFVQRLVLFSLFLLDTVFTLIEDWGLLFLQLSVEGGLQLERGLPLETSVAFFKDSKKSLYSINSTSPAILEERFPLCRLLFKTFNIGLILEAH